MSRARAMLSRRRAILYAALALAVPLPALALTGGGSGGLEVQASLGGCGVAPGGIVCEINASWNEVEGAEYYTASVVAPDGSVTDAGNVGGGNGTSLWVPYVGNGTYSVTVSAWGVEESGEPEVIERDKATAGGETEEQGRGGAKELDRGSPETPEGDQPTGPDPAEPSAEGAQPTCEATELPTPGEQAQDGEQPAEQPDREAAATTEVAPTTEATDPDCPPPASPRTP